MSDASDLEAREVARFLSCYAQDLAAGRTATITEYLRQFPACPDAIAREFLELHGDSPQQATLGLGRYKLLRELGRGGQGIVHLAEDLELGRPVALKLLQRNWMSDTGLARLKREARVASRLDHPAICTIYDTATEGETTYVAMRYVPGQTLARRIAQGQLPDPAQVVLFFEATARALHVAHEAGVVHRDLKPANLMVTMEETPVILDFGLARLESEDATLTHSGEVMGTPSYMSPEQIAGKGAVGRATDIYSLGISLYEALTLHRPFDHPTRDAVLLAIRTQPLPDARRWNPAIPRDLCAVLATATEKHPARRYQTALDLAEDLRRIRAHEPILARPPGTALRAWRWVQRHPLVTTIMGVVLTALAVSTTAAYHAFVSGERAEAQRIIAVAERRTAVREAYIARIAAATIALQLDNPLSARGLLASCPPAERNWEWRYLSRQLDTCVTLVESKDVMVAAAFAGDDGGIETITSAGALRRFDRGRAEPRRVADLGVGPIGPAAFDASGTRLVAVLGKGADASAGLWDAATGSKLAQIPTGMPKVLTVAVAPGASHVALGGERNVVWEPSTGASLKGFGGRNAASLAFSADGRRLGTGYNLLNGSPGWALGWDLAAGQAIGAGVQVSKLRVNAVDLDAEGTTLAFGTLDKRAGLLDLQQRRVLREFPGHGATVTSVALAPGGKQLATAADDGTVRVWDCESGQPLRTLTGAASTVRDLVFDRDGQHLLGRCDRSVRVWSIAPIERVLRGHTSYVYGVAFAEGGRRLVTGAWDGTFRIWDVASEECVAVLATKAGSVLALAVAPDAALVATAHVLGVRLWSGDTGALIGELALAPPERVKAVAFSADGRRLAARSERWLAVWETTSRTLLRRWECLGSTQFGAVAFAPGATLVAIDGPRTDATVFDLEAGVRAAELACAGRGVHALAFDRRGTRLASGSHDGSIQLWDTASWHGRALQRRHDGAVYGVAFAPDGSRLASGSNDTTVRVWDVESGEQAALLTGHSDYAFALAFSPDGATLASGSGDCSVRLWSTGLEREREAAALRVKLARPRARELASAVLTETGGADRAVARLRGDAGLDEILRETALQELLRRQVESIK